MVVCRGGGVLWLCVGEGGVVVVCRGGGVLWLCVGEGGCCGCV